MTVAGSLSVMFSVPVPALNAVGDRNCTRIWQVAPCARLVAELVGHVVLSTLNTTPFVTLVNEVVNGPTIGPGPTLPTVTVCAVLKPFPNRTRKFSDEGVLLIFTPVPLSDTGEPATEALLPVMVNVPFTRPDVVGENTTLMVQVAPAARVAPQVPPDRE